ncbi:MAG: ABC transporter permease [Bacteroidales bacterium]|nr:ABC transporter permease [Bacteroidales bacterium]
MGHTIAGVLFRNNDNVIGKTIKIRNTKLTIIRIFKKEGTSVFENNLNNLVVVPIISNQKLFNVNSEISSPSIIVKPKSNLETEFLLMKPDK